MLTKILNTVLFFLLTSLISIAQNNWSKEVSLDIKGKPLNDIIKEITHQSNLNLIYSQNKINVQNVSVKINSSADQVLTTILSSYGYAIKKFEDNSGVIYKKPKPKKIAKPVVHEPVLVDNESTKILEITKPTLLSKVNIVYPQEAIRQNIKGVVSLNLFVTSKGDVKDVRIKESSGSKILDATTVNYVRKLKFLPAEMDGKYTDVWTNLQVRYDFE